MVVRIRFLSCVIGALPLASPTAASSYLSGASSGDTAIFGGGSTSADCTSGFLDTAFDANDAMVDVDTLSVARCGLTSASLWNEGVLIFAGGHDSSGYLDTVDVYRSTTRDTSDAATTLALTGKRAYSVASSDDTTIFVTGGFEQKRLSYIKGDAVDMFQVGHNGTVLQLSAPPMPRGGVVFHGAAAVEGTLWVGGGTNDFGMSDMIQVLDVDSSGNRAVWRDADVTPNLSSNRTRLAAAALSTSACAALGSPIVCFAGGEGEQEVRAAFASDGWTCSGSLCVSSAVDCFDSVTGQALATGLTLSEPRSRLVGLGVGCTILFAGGKTLDGYSSVIDVFDLSSVQQGGDALATAAALSEARADLAAALSGGGSDAVFVGGMNQRGVVDAVDVLPGPYGLAST